MLLGIIKIDWCFKINEYWIIKVLVNLVDFPAIFIDTGFIWVRFLLRYGVSAKVAGNKDNMKR